MTEAETLTAHTETVTPEQAKTRWYAQRLAAATDREADLTVALMQARQDLAKARADLHNATTGAPADVKG